MTAPEKMPIGGDFDMVIELPLAVANYKNVVVWLVDAKCVPFGKYALNALADHNSTDVSATGASEITINVQKSVSILPAKGNATIEIYEAITDAGRESAQFAQIADPAVLCEFYEVKIGKITV